MAEKKWALSSKTPYRGDWNALPRDAGNLRRMRNLRRSAARRALPPKTNLANARCHRRELSL